MTESPRRPVVGVAPSCPPCRPRTPGPSAGSPLADVWAFPGGRVEFGERLADAAAREVREETGVTVAVAGTIDFANIILRDPAGIVERHFVLIVFEGAWVEGEPIAGDDAADALWVPESDAVRFQNARYRAHPSPYPRGTAGRRPPAQPAPDAMPQ